MIKSVHSANPDAKAAVREIQEQLTGFEPCLIIFFASWDYNPADISAFMKNAYPNADVAGCSVQAAICNTQTINEAVSVFAIDSGTVQKSRIFILENLSGSTDVTPAFNDFDAYFGEPLSKADYKKYCGMILIDTNAHKEPEIMERIGEKTNIMFLGGSAGNHMDFSNTYIYANGKVYKDAALLCVLKAQNGIDYIKTQSVEVTDTVFTVTKVSEDALTVHEFDGIPAQERYTEHFNIFPKHLESKLFLHPLGVVIDGDVYIRAPEIGYGGSLGFSAKMHKGARLSVLNITNIIPDTKAAIEKMINKRGIPAGLIDFRCGYRAMQLYNEDKMEEYGKLFAGFPTSGFSTYGEQCIGHMNQTSVMMVFY